LPETEITREQLLASVHVLKPGDVLVLRFPDRTPADRMHEAGERVRARLEPLGVKVLVMTRDITVEVVRAEKVGA
jgi:hypothetical protein